jgi:hypothetical protein
LLILDNPSSVYTNCLLVSLNARQHFRDKLQNAHLDALVFVGSSHPSPSCGQMVVRVSQHAEIDCDPSPTPENKYKSAQL